MLIFGLRLDSAGRTTGLMFNRRVCIFGDSSSMVPVSSWGWGIAFMVMRGF